MSKYFQRGLALLYILLTAFCFLILLSLSGVYLSDRVVITIMTVWLLFCLSSAWLFTDIRLFFRHTCRKPVREEQEKLDRCFGEVLQNANCRKAFRFRIDEAVSLNAFATGHNTIAVSKAAIQQLTEEELKGLLAHELGHLVSKDPIIGAAVATAFELPRAVRFIYLHAKAVILKVIIVSGMIAARISILLLAALLMALLYFMEKRHLLLPIVAVIAFVLVFNILNRVFSFFSLMISRFTEYKQDAYAHQLGYGAGLSAVLKKIAASGEQPVNPYFVIMNSTHPVIHNRIRKLEALSARNAQNPDR